ncbi:MAG TPA: BCAM0308 family protein [Alphaproteobacteria bacterium]
MKTHDVSRRPQRRDRLLREHIHDPYKTRLKLDDPTVCPQCGAVYRSDRWQWGIKPADAREELCQACHRINDKYPAAEITVHGAFVARHRQEILDLVRNEEKIENAEHPLHRIMDIVADEDGLRITTTDIHLPRRIGLALAHAFNAPFDFDYDKEGYFLRGSWRRDD